MEFSLLTYNVEKFQNNYRKTLKVFFSLIDEIKPSIITLQECTDLVYQILFKEMSLLGYTHIDLFPIVKGRPEGELIFISKPFSFLEVEYIPFRTSSQSRGLTRALVQLQDDITLEIYTSQLEVGSRLTHIRKQQIEAIPQMIELSLTRRDHHPSVILFSADTGVLNYQKHLRCPVDWYDTWEEAGSETEKYTVDSDTNHLIVSNLKIQDRPDQVWVKTSTVRDCTCTSYELVGKNTGISTHHGLLVKFEIK